MREHLIQYVNLLFAGTNGLEEVRDEMLQNTLDRYDDLVSHGKSPEAAYQLSISGIGDLREILGGESATAQPVEPVHVPTADDQKKHVVSIAMYILCPLPLLILNEFGADILGLCMTIIVVAAATVLRLTMSKPQTQPVISTTPDPNRKLRESINRLIWVVGVAAYLGLSFATGAWEITWIIFPLIGAIQGLAGAIIDGRKA